MRVPTNIKLYRKQWTLVKAAIDSQIRKIKMEKS